MAIASRGVERRFTLVEPIGKKAAFLRAVARELALPIKVESVRVEQIDSRETYDLVTSRALTALSDLLAMATRFVAPGGHMLLHKGRNYREELAASTAHAHLNVVVHPSVTDPESAILEVSNPQPESAA
jgi:16S rRNA (guanine527-N7)-methyltransferase